VRACRGDTETSNLGRFRGSNRPNGTDMHKPLELSFVDVNHLPDVPEQLNHDRGVSLQWQGRLCGPSWLGQSSSQNLAFLAAGARQSDAGVALAAGGDSDVGTAAAHRHTYDGQRKIEMNQQHAKASRRPPGDLGRPPITTRIRTGPMMGYPETFKEF
jgi:hypothetical protein